MGLLVVTPLWNNTMTPFLRWETGDYVRFVDRGETDGPFGVFPMIRHAARTAGFFKVRGININQGDIEDFLYRVRAIADFKIEAVETEALDTLRISIEVAGGADADVTGEALVQSVRETFELTPEIVVNRARNARTGIRRRGEAEPVYRPARNAGLIARAVRSARAGNTWRISSAARRSSGRSPRPRRSSAPRSAISAPRTCRRAPRRSADRRWSSCRGPA